MATKENQVFHDVKCRRDFHNNGQTPEQQMLSRLQRFMKKPAFKTLVRDAVTKELRAMRKADSFADDFFGPDQKLPAGIDVKKC